MTTHGTAAMNPDAGLGLTESSWGQRLAEAGWVPDALIRLGIRQHLRTRLDEQAARAAAVGVAAAVDAFAGEMAGSPIAVGTDAANAQHYELPPAFFATVLGRWRKYSCGWWPDGVDDLDAAEAAMLALTCERAGVEDGMTVLDLGCGWGSLTRWILAHYPHCRVVAVSNAAAQGAAIRALAGAHGDALEVHTADVNTFAPERRVDRIVSVEMFEHVRNWPRLLQRMRGWLTPEGRAFLHVFCHRTYAYPYEVAGPGDWMARFFFTGGLMPSFELIDRFRDDLAVEARWPVNGRHYARTCEAWLDKMDGAGEEIRAIFDATYGPAASRRWVGRWRIFFLACAELFAYRAGHEWHVAHYRLAPRRG